MSFIKISVIIPTYKPQAYLWECLESLSNQTFPKNKFEVVLVLNGCCEPYDMDIKDWIHNHHNLNVKYIQIDRGGVSNARNVALKESVGLYVMFLDDDDYISNTTLEDLYAKADGESIVIFKPLAFYDGDKPFAYSRTNEYNKNFTNVKIPFYKVRKNFSGPVMKLIPSSVIDGREYNLCFKNGEDSLYMFLLSNKMKDVVFAPPSAIYYRRIRYNSAATNQRTYKSVTKNSLILVKEYTNIYLSSLSMYKFCFYLTRVLGAFKAILHTRKNDIF